MQMQQLQIMQQRQAQLQRRDAGHPSFTGSVNGMGSESLLGQSTASVLAAKMYEERMKHPNSMDPESSSQLDANRMALLKSSTNQGYIKSWNMLPDAFTFMIEEHEERCIYLFNILCLFPFSNDIASWSKEHLVICLLPCNRFKHKHSRCL